MTVFQDVFTVESTNLALDVLVKLGLGALLGGAIGIERERSGRPAGIRTHMLLVIGVVLIAEVSKHFGAPDNSRIAAQIVTGVGFLGAGTILRTGVEVKGLTTAASLWAASAIGMAISAGGAFMIIALAATLLTLFTLAVVDNIESRFAVHGALRELTITAVGRDDLDRLLEELAAKGHRLESVRVVREEPHFEAVLAIYGSKQILLRDCLANRGISSAEFQ